MDEGKPEVPTSTWVRLALALIWFLTFTIGGIPVGCGIGLIIEQGGPGSFVGAFLGGLIGIVSGLIAAVYVFKKNK